MSAVSPVVVTERIAQWAARTPDAVAVVDEGAVVTYREVLRQADGVARALLESGIRPGEVVGVCLGRSASLVVALLGVLRAGCAYLPLDPDYPPSRLGFMLADCGVQAVLTSPDAEGGLPATGVRKLDVTAAESTGPEVMRAGRDALPVPAPGDLAYVIYTSGSTGKPKGVAVEHGNVARLFDAVRRRIDFDDHDVWSWFHSAAFDFSVWEIWGALSTGARVVVVRTEAIRDPARFLQLVADSGTTLLSQTPSAFRRLLALPEMDALLRGVRAVVLGGEPVSVGEFRHFIDSPPAALPTIYNLYGITEVTVHATVKELTAGDLTRPVSSPIGTPLDDLRMVVLDEERRVLPAGERGELWIGGAGVARGYVNRPELTAERFVRGVVPGSAAVRWYRSGDLARELSGGEFEYLGRVDRQVKLRGFRIELGEIEAVLADHPAVSAATVVLRDAGDDGRLVAHLVLRNPAGLSDDDLREWAAARLPAHMLPSSLSVVPALPLTPNGKLDRQALASMSGQPLPRRDDGQSPETDIEQTLHEIWAGLLGVPSIHRDDSFFSIGGDSLLALRLVTSAKAAGLHLTLKDLFRHPTLSSLAAAARANNS